MASDLPWFPCYVRDWLGSTARAELSLEQQGIYFALMCWQWDSPDCTLPDHPPTLCRLVFGTGCDVDACQKVLGPVVARYFPPVDGDSSAMGLPSSIANIRLREVWLEQVLAHDLKSKAGKIGAKKRWAGKTYAKIARPSVCQWQNDGNTKANTKKGLTTDVVKPGAASQKRFVPPTVEEVRAYCLERKNHVDAQVWHDHYTANGWRVGKNPMKDWRAAVRTWERNSIGGSKAVGPAPALTVSQMVRRYSHESG